MTEIDIDKVTEEAVSLLKGIISIPSYSFDEEKVADYLFDYLQNKSQAFNDTFKVLRIKNNLVAYPRFFDKQKETLMLNAHIDTVRPAESYTTDPFGGMRKNGAIYGLGSNDDGGSVVSLLQTFLHFIKNAEKENAINLNIILVLSAEEERSGAGGMSLVMQELPDIGIIPNFAIIGEPTGMKAAVAERGLLVLDGLATGMSGHAARNEGINALYIAIDDIQKLRNYKFKKQSPVMGEIKLTVTQINAGTAHNVIPDKCSFVTDIRPTEQYTNTEIWELLQKEVQSELKPRNLTNRTSATPARHLLMQAIKKIGIETYISPTTSDWMRLEIPAVKMGPGQSERSHKADEFIYIDEIRKGIASYIQFIHTLSQIEKEIQAKQ